jgi:hypothetical protein
MVFGSGSSDGGRVSQNLRDNLPPQDHAGKKEKKKKGEESVAMSSARFEWDPGRLRASWTEGQGRMKLARWKTSGPGGKLFECGDLDQSGEIEAITPTISKLPDLAANRAI